MVFEFRNSGKYADLSVEISTLYRPAMHTQLIFAEDYKQAADYWQRYLQKPKAQRGPIQIYVPGSKLPRYDTVMHEAD